LKIVLITGALGQDGIILSKIFLKKKFKVFGIIRKKRKKIVPKVKYILNNLKSKEKIDKILKKVKPSIIIHLAATNNSYSFKNKENFKNNYLLNLIYTKNLINSAVEINSLKKFIFAGSSLMFKNQKKITVTEKSNFGSKDYYSKYKIDSFKYLQKKTKIYDFDSTTVLLFNHDSVYRNKKFLIPRLVKAFIRKDKNLIEKIFSLI
jgi:GDPmannose 4,6-dehydratase